MDSTLLDIFYKFESTNWWFVGRRKLVLSLINTYLSCKGSARILDAGCGTGAMLDHLSRYGSAMGVDIAKEASDYCRSRGRNEVAGGDITALPFAESGFDLVTALDVVEHIVDEKTAFDQLARTCKPGGIVVVTVPAYQWLWSPHDVLNHHERRYVARELRAQIEQAGLRVLRLTYANTFLFPVVVLVRVFRKLFLAHRYKSDWDVNMHVPSLINRLLIAIYSLEVAILKHLDMPFGVSVVCVAKKGGEESNSCITTLSIGREHVS